MTHTFRELVVGGVLVSPIISYVAASLIIFALARPILHLIGFSNGFSNPSIAELSLYVAICGLLILIV